MKLWVRILFLATLLGTAPAFAANKTTATLLLAADSARVGDTVVAGIHLRMAPHWHIYWRNPGDFAMPTTVEWQLPAGVTVGELAWPTPELFAVGDIRNYVYNDEVVLLAPLKLATNLSAGPLEITAKLKWQECEKICVQGKADVSATLTIGPETKPSANVALLNDWQNKIPQPGTNLGAFAFWEKPAKGDTRAVLLQWDRPQSGTNAEFFAYVSDKFEVSILSESVTAPMGKSQLRKIIKKTAEWPTVLVGVLVLKSADGKTSSAFEVNFPITAATETSAGGVSNSPPKVTAQPAQSFWMMLCYAFIGGMILNIMPCVLPVISLKILGFVQQSKEAPGRVKVLGLAYTAGVLASFLALALMVIAVKSAGQQASWGMQFGNAKYLVVLTTLVVLIALNLFGLFEVTLGGGALNTVGNLAQSDGSVGAFFNGVFATALATPCTAPFLGAALGFAFTQPPSGIVAIFLTAGLGLALPYLLLSWQPAWLKFLPRPGVWMEKFKIAMGFPMLATAVWLFTLTTEHYPDVLWFGLFLVLIALAVWIFGEFVQRGRSRKGLALGFALGFALFAYAYGLESQLDWRHPPVSKVTGAAEEIIQESPDGIEWRRWSTAAVAKARAEGRPVFVDFTAKWCTTCQLNKKSSIEISSVRAKLKAIHAVALLGDNTKLPSEIITELARFGRAGVPLVLVYPKSGGEPEVLPEFLRPNIVLEALERAGK